MIKSLVITVGMIVTVAVGPVQAKGHPFKGKFSGSVLPSSFDINGDGVPAAEATIAGESSLGHFRAQPVADIPFVGPGVCDSGNPGILFEGGAGSEGIVFRFVD